MDPGGTVCGGLCGLLVFFLYLASVIWAFGDAQRRGKSGCLIALVVLLFWPVSLILWLIFRPGRTYY
jgi:hypothetical protein